MITAILAVFTVVVSACAGALASYIQIRATKRDEIFLQKIEQAYSACQDYVNNLDVIFLNMEKTLHGKLTLSQHFELASQPRDNVRAYRDLKMYLTLYFPDTLPALSEMYEVRGRLVQLYFDGEKSLKANSSVSNSIKTEFSANIKALDTSTKKLQSEIASKAHDRFA